jgi:hypothetical protein
MNKNRLRNLTGKCEVSKRSRIKLDEQIYTTNLDAALEHLYLAYEHLSKHLDGRNEFGMLTNILNSAYDVKKHLKS